MLNISMIRVDERLIHGQITIKWIKAKKANRIVIIDDEAAFDPILKKIFKMTLTKDIELDIYPLDEGINILTTNNLGESVIVLVKRLWLVKEIHKRGVRIEEINIGRIPSGVGKKMIHSSVFLSDEDIEAVNYFKGKEIPLIIQIVPDSIPVSIYDLVD